MDFGKSKMVRRIMLLYNYIIEMIENIYPIENTLNLHKEQLSGAYLDKNFWPEFSKILENFKNTLITKVRNKEAYSVLRIGHSELSAFYIGLNSNKRVGNFLGRQSKYDFISDKTFIKFFESVKSSDIKSAQTGYDFLEWLSQVLGFLEFYNKINNSNLFLQKKKECLNYKINYNCTKDIIDLPLDIIYGLIANKWFFKTFKNKIGLIGSDKKLNIISELIKYKEYQEYLGTDYFTDYIEVPEIAALDSDDLEDNIVEKIKKSSCDIFLIGTGISKLKFFHLLKSTKQCVYIDVGHGICMIAGYGDSTRPYCGTWTNYRIKNKVFECDDLGSGNTRSIVYLSGNILKE